MDPVAGHQQGVSRILALGVWRPGTSWTDLRWMLTHTSPDDDCNIHHHNIESPPAEWHERPCHRQFDTVLHKREDATGVDSEI